jgi:hypothetical protein
MTKVKYSDDEKLRQDYAQWVCDKKSWLSPAQKLIAAANLMTTEIDQRWRSIAPHPDDPNKPTFKNDGLNALHFQSVYNMLIAFAVENLLKAHLVTSNATEYYSRIAETGKLPKEIKSHDLLALARKCKLVLTKEDETLLQRFYQHMVWKGRYFIPLDYRTFFHLHGENVIPSTGYMWSQNEVVEMREFLERLMSQLEIQF